MEITLTPVLLVPHDNVPRTIAVALSFALAYLKNLRLRKVLKTTFFKVTYLFLSYDHIPHAVKYILIAINHTVPPPICA